MKVIFCTPNLKKNEKLIKSKLHTIFVIVHFAASCMFKLMKYIQLTYKAYSSLKIDMLFCNLENIW